MNAIIEKVKVALRIVTDDFNDEIEDLINAAMKDLSIAGVTNDDTTNALIIRAIITYCKIHFGDIDKVENYDRLKASYDEQKAQMQMSTGYTTW